MEQQLILICLFYVCEKVLLFTTKLQIHVTSLTVAQKKIISGCNDTSVTEKQYCFVAGIPLSVWKWVMFSNKPYIFIKLGDRFWWKNQRDRLCMALCLPNCTTCRYCIIQTQFPAATPQFFALPLLNKYPQHHKLKVKATLRTLLADIATCQSDLAALVVRCHCARGAHRLLWLANNDKWMCVATSDCFY